MTQIEMKPIGSLVEPVLTWNPLREEPSETFQYVDLSAVDQDEKTITGAREVSCSEAPSRARQLVTQADILVSTVRPNLNGVAVVPAELDAATASTGFCVLRPKASVLSSSYLFHWVKSPQFVADMVSKATGASYPAVSDKIILSSQIPYVSLPEQRRISAILEQADALRAKRREALAQLDSLEDSIFEDFQSRTRKSSRAIPLVDLADKTRGSFVNGPFGSDLLTSELQDEGVPVVYIRDIRNGEYQRVSTVCVSERKARDLAVCAVSSGDVLIAKVGDPPGVAAVYPVGEPNAVVTQDVIRIRPSGDIARSEFIKAYLNSSIGRWKIAGITVEATRARISLGDFKKLTVELPSLSEQDQFVAQVNALSDLRTSHAKALGDLDALFASLQHRAFRGEL